MVGLYQPESRRCPAKATCRTRALGDRGKFAVSATLLAACCSSPRDVTFFTARQAERPHCATAGLLASVPRQFLHLPQERWLGPGWDFLKVLASCRNGSETPLNFMLDSGLTVSMLATQVPALLAIDVGEEQRRFLGVNGDEWSPQAQLLGLRVHAGPVLPTLRPLVRNFPQMRIGNEEGYEVHGMLGMEFYEEFGVEVGGSELRLWEADKAETVADDRGLLKLTTESLPARLLGITVELASGLRGSSPDVRIRGIVDTGASHSVLNWAAAGLLLGLQKDDSDRLVETHGGVDGTDISGNSLFMPVVPIKLQLRSSDEASVRPALAFDTIEAAIGDIALFDRIFSSGEAVALVGQDILTQRPMLLAARQRLLCFQL